MKSFFKKFSSYRKKLNFKKNFLKFFPVLVLKSSQQKYYMKEEDSNENSSVLKDDYKKDFNKSFELERSDKIKGDYENRIRAFSSIEKKFFLFAKKGADGNYVMDYVDFFNSFIPFPYSKISSRDEIIEILKNNPIYVKNLEKIDINRDGLISFEEYIIFCVFLTIPTSYFYKFSIDKKTITRQQFVEAVIKFINDENVVKITEKSLFDGRIIKTDYNKLYVNLTSFTDKVFQKVSFEIEKEFLELQNELKFAVLLYEFYRFPESKKNSICIENFGKVLISYINIYKQKNFLKDLKFILQRYPSIEVTIEDFISFYLFLDYFMNYIIKENYFERKKVIKFEDLIEIEAEFQKHSNNQYFELFVKESLLKFMFELLDTDKSGYLDFNEIVGILKRRNALSNKDYKESGNSVYEFFKKGVNLLKSNLEFLRKDK